MDASSALEGMRGGHAQSNRMQAGLPFRDGHRSSELGSSEQSETVLFLEILECQTAKAR